MIKHSVNNQKTYKTNFLNRERALQKNLNEEKKSVLFLKDGSVFYCCSFYYSSEIFRKASSDPLKIKFY
jgi:hypothetical protein